MATVGVVYIDGLMAQVEWIGPEVGAVLFCIDHVNWVNSGNGSSMLTAPYTFVLDLL